MTKLKPFPELVTLANKEFDARIEEKVNYYLDAIARTINDRLLDNHLSNKSNYHIQLDITDIYRTLLKGDHKILQLFTSRIQSMQYYIEQRTLIVNPTLPIRPHHVNSASRPKLSADEELIEKWSEGSTYYLHTNLPS